jgi:hypothetical protein
MKQSNEEVKMLLNGADGSHTLQTFRKCIRHGLKFERNCSSPCLQAAGSSDFDDTEVDATTIRRSQLFHGASTALSGFKVGARISEEQRRN